MAATNPSKRNSPTATSTRSGVGMAHLTVVPTNFAASPSTDESDD